MGLTWHEESLAPGCRAVLAGLSSSVDLRDFYLAGGTALALRLGHRISADLDFFSESNFLKTADRARLKDRLSKVAKLKVDEEKDGTLHARLGETHVSFFHYPVSLLERPVLWRKLRCACLADIGAMKLAALVGRGSRKDFLDLHVLTSGPIPLADLLKKAQKKFRHSSDFAAQSFRALVYFEDARTEDMPRVLKPVAWKNVEAHFEKEVRALARKVLP